MMIHLSSLDGIVKPRILNRIKKDIVFHIMNNQKTLDKNLKPKDIIPDRIHFSAYVNVKPAQHRKKSTLSTKNVETQFFSDIKDFRL